MKDEIRCLVTYCLNNVEETCTCYLDNITPNWLSCKKFCIPVGGK